MSFNNELTASIRRLRETPVPQNLSKSATSTLIRLGWQTKLGHVANKIRHDAPAMAASEVERLARKQVRRDLGLSDGD